MPLPGELSAEVFLLRTSYGSCHFFFFFSLLLETSHAERNTFWGKQTQPAKEALKRETIAKGKIVFPSRF